MLFDGLSDEERVAPEARDPPTWQGIQLNATEWLLAEGRILVKGEPRRVAECLFGQGGPLFTSGQRHWITQLAARPLRLYDVTDVIPSKQMTLCDALDAEAPAVIVHEKSGSQASLVGRQAGFRIMEGDVITSSREPPTRFRAWRGCDSGACARGYGSARPAAE